MTAPRPISNAKHIGTLLTAQRRTVRSKSNYNELETITGLVTVTIETITTVTIGETI